MKNKEIGLAVIICGKDQWPGRKSDVVHPIIFTTKLPGEMKKDVKAKLDEALLKLPFETVYQEISFHDVPEIFELMDQFSVVSVHDFPGAKIVKFEIHLVCEREFFLPRDQETGEFINIDKQVQCLGVLMSPKIRKDWKIKGGKFIPK